MQLMRAPRPQAQPWIEERKSPPLGNHRGMAMERLGAGGHARIVGLEMRWVPVTITTQVPLLRINADGVPCGLPGALGSEWCRRGLLLQGSAVQGSVV